MERVPIENVLSILRRETRRFRHTALMDVARRDDPFRVLVSCILSLRTRDPVTAAASDRLFRLADTPERMVRLSERRIQQAIYPVSFYRVKARNIRALCRILLEHYQGRVPAQMEQLLQLPNVGRKTANITLTLGFGKPGIAVDTHVHRISNRLGLVETRTPEQTEFALRELLPTRFWIEYNDLLVTWGQNVCTPLSPRCSGCAVSDHCKRAGVERSR